jgi:hypothetical protein
MKDFVSRFSASIGALAFGAAGFVSMYFGAQIMTSLFRATVAGIAGMALGKAFAVIIYDGPVVTPSAAYGKKEEED